MATVRKLVTVVGVETDSQSFKKADAAMKQLGTTTKDFAIQNSKVLALFAGRNTVLGRIAIAFETTRFGIKKLAAAADGLAKKLLNLVAKVFKLKTALTGLVGFFVSGAIAVGIRKLSSDVATLGDNTAKTASKLGVAAEDLQKFRFAAELTGVSANTADTGLQRFARRAAEAAKGSGEAKDALRELGVQLRDNQGNLRPTFDLLGDVAEGLRRVQNPADRVRLAMRLFDTEGVSLVNTLKVGRVEFRKMAEEAMFLGGVMSGPLLRMSEKFVDSQLRVRTVFQGIKNTIAEELLPSTIAFNNQLVKWIASNREIIRSRIVQVIGFLQRRFDDLTMFVRNLVTAGRRIGSVFLAAFRMIPERVLKIVGAFIAWRLAAAALKIPAVRGLAKWLLLAGIIEDIEVFLQGGDSLFGRTFGPAIRFVKRLNLFLSETFEWLEKIAQKFGGKLISRLADTDLNQFLKDSVDKAGRFLREKGAAIIEGSGLVVQSQGVAPRLAPANTNNSASLNQNQTINNTINVASPNQVGTVIEGAVTGATDAANRQAKNGFTNIKATQ